MLLDRYIEEVHALVDHIRKVRGLPPVNWPVRSLASTEEIIKRIVGKQEVCPRCLLPLHGNGSCLFMFERRKPRFRKQREKKNGSTRVVHIEGYNPPSGRKRKSHFRESVAIRRIRERKNMVGKKR